MRGEKKEKEKLYHVVHKVPPGDSPYVKAKHLQLVEKDQNAAILWFWKAINGGHRVDSALKDMAVVMKQQNLTEEVIEAIRSCRHLCSKQAQGSLDNLLLDLYKKCGKIEEQIELLKQKLHMIYLGEAFNGKNTKTSRSHGKKFQVSIKQETARILVIHLSTFLYILFPIDISTKKETARMQSVQGLDRRAKAIDRGNLGWAYMQQGNYYAAEVVYRKAQVIEPDANKACNLGLCLIKQGCLDEAQLVLEDIINGMFSGSDNNKAISRAEEMLRGIGAFPSEALSDIDFNIGEEIMERLDLVLNEWSPYKSKRLPIFEEISTYRDQIAC